MEGWWQWWPWQRLAGGGSKFYRGRFAASHLQFGFKKWLILPIKTETYHLAMIQFLGKNNMHMKAGVRDVFEVAQIARAGSDGLLALRAENIELAKTQAKRMKVKKDLGT